MIALVTGASGGIGLELARLFAADGHDLVLVSRGGQRLATIARDLEERYRVEVRPISRDLANPIAAISLFDECGEVDFLVNNAGFGHRGAFAEEDPVMVSEMLQVNVAAVTQLTRMFLPSMVERGSGRILNVASIAAFQPGPLMAVYYATKAYVLSFTEALGEELVGTGVTATALCPGVVPSGFQDVAGLDEDLPFMRSPGTKSAEEVAEAGYRAMMSGRRVLIPGGLNKVGAHAARIAPRRAVLTMVRRIHPPDKNPG